MLRDESWWLDDYATFRVLHDREGGRLWFEWPDDVKRRENDALTRVRTGAWRDVLFYQCLQWIASTQWAAARQAAAEAGVALFGDLPFMVDLHSADVWANQDSFYLDRSVGVPPDAFSATGQDWGMPAYNWEALQAGGFGWLRDPRAPRRAVVRWLPRRSSRWFLPHLLASTLGPRGCAVRSIRATRSTATWRTRARRLSRKRL